MKQTQLQKISEQTIQELRDTGLIKKFTPEYNEVFVDNLIWSNIDYQTKENVGKILAQYCSQVKNSDAIWVDIRDNMSGKQLAKYSQAFGFSVE